MTIPRKIYKFNSEKSNSNELSNSFSLVGLDPETLRKLAAPYLVGMLTRGFIHELNHFVGPFAFNLMNIEETLKNSTVETKDVEAMIDALDESSHLLTRILNLQRMYLQLITDDKNTSICPADGLLKFGLNLAKEIYSRYGLSISLKPSNLLIETKGTILLHVFICALLALLDLNNRLDQKNKTRTVTVEYSQGNAILISQEGPIKAKKSLAYDASVELLMANVLISDLGGRIEVDADYDHILIVINKPGEIKLGVENVTENPNH